MGGLVKSYVDLRSCENIVSQGGQAPESVVRNCAEAFPDKFRASSYYENFSASSQTSYLEPIKIDYWKTLYGFSKICRSIIKRGGMTSPDKAHACEKRFSQYQADECSVQDKDTDFLISGPSSKSWPCRLTLKNMLSRLFN